MQSFWNWNIQSNRKVVRIMIIGLGLFMSFLVILVGALWLQPFYRRDITSSVEPTQFPRRTPDIVVSPIDEEQSSSEDNTVLVVTPTVRPAEESLPVLRSTPVPSWQAQEPYKGIWLTKEELEKLPTHGIAWRNLQQAADRDPGQPNLSDQTQMNNVLVLAKALVFARTGQEKYRDEVIENLRAAIGTEEGGRTLALGRELVAYVIAADLINLPEDAELDRDFRNWLRYVLTENLDGRTLIFTNEDRPNNWGTHTGASRAAVAIYLGDEAELERTAQIFKGYLGDRETYSGFTYGKLYWQADSDNPVGVNPLGAEKDGRSIDGALPEEMRRGGKFRWPPKETGYAWEALQGALVQAELLHRAGYSAWKWEDQALLRAVKFLYDIGWEPEGDDIWQPWLVNAVYGTDFPVESPTDPGKNMGWTDWTHSDHRFQFSQSVTE